MANDARYLCLDFVNSISWRIRAQPHERLTSYADLVAWSQGAGVVTEHTAQHLLKEATRRPAGAAAALERAIALWEAIHWIFSAVARGRTPEPTDVAALNDTLSETASRLQLAWTGGGFA